jgi:hypothetical protein
VVSVPSIKDAILLVAPFVIFKAASVTGRSVPGRLTVATVSPATEIEKLDDTVDLFTNTSSSIVTLDWLN